MKEKQHITKAKHTYIKQEHTWREKQTNK